MIKYIVYRTTDVSTGEYYIGMTKWDTTRPIRYWGSFWGHWQPDKANLIRETLAEYPDRESSRRAEPLWIEPHLGNPLCKNTHAVELPEASDRCDKPGTMLGKKHKDEVRENMRQAHLGKSPSEETRKKVSEKLKGRPGTWLGKSFTPEHIEKLRHCHLGKKRSQETREKIRLSLKDKSQPQVQCPHCGKLGGISIMKRWHFDNCKKLK